MLKDRIRSLLAPAKPERERRDILFGLTNDEDQALITKIKEKRITYLSLERMASIAASSRLIEQLQIPGIIIEAGCALGGSSVLIASIKDPTRKLEIYDVFGMIPPPSKRDTADVHNR